MWGRKSLSKDPIGQFSLDIMWLVRGCEQAGSSTEVSLHKNILELSSGGNQFCFRGHVLSFYKEAHGEGSPSQNIRLLPRTSMGSPILKKS